MRRLRLIGAAARLREFMSDSTERLTDKVACKPDQDSDEAKDREETKKEETKKDEAEKEEAERKEAEDDGDGDADDGQQGDVAAAAAAVIDDDDEVQELERCWGENSDWADELLGGRGPEVRVLAQDLGPRAEELPCAIDDIWKRSLEKQDLDDAQLQLRLLQEAVRGSFGLVNLFLIPPILPYSHFFFFSILISSFLF